MLRPVMRAQFGTRRVAAAISVAAAIGLAAAVARAETIRVEVKSLGFSPAQVTARVGDTIEWTNSDFIAHTATAKTREWDVQVPVNSKKTLVLKKAGTIEYFCRFHPNMTGALTVEEVKR